MHRVDDDAVRAEAVRQLFQSPLPALTNLAVGGLLAVVAWDALPDWVLLGWLLTMAAVTGLRMALWRWFHRSAPTPGDTARWERRMQLGVAAAGLLWALTGAAIVATPLPIQVAGVIAIAVCGMIAGAIFSLTHSMPVFLSYAVPAALGPIVGFLAVGTPDHAAVGGMGLVYLSVALLWGRSAERRVVDGIRLQLENEALVVDLENARAEVALAERLKRESFANLGHELRTPLNAIIGFAQSLEAELWGPLGNARYREYAKAIGDSGRHLFDLIQGILDIARQDAGVLELVEERFDLGEMAGACVAMLDGSARANGVELSAELPEGGVQVTADTTKLRQIVINLVANAVRFTPAGGRVVVGVARRADGSVELRVEDNGIGLAPEDIPRALEPFIQIQRDGARNPGGAGLGLPLSKRLAEAHGGRLEIDSAPGEGMTVRVVLPAARAADALSQAPRR